MKIKTQRQKRKEILSEVDECIKKIENTLNVSPDGMVYLDDVFGKVMRTRQQVQNILSKL